MEPSIMQQNGDGDYEPIDDRSSGNLSDAPPDFVSSIGMLPSKSSAATIVSGSEGDGDDGDDGEYDTGANAAGLMIASDDDKDDGGDGGVATSSHVAVAASDSCSSDETGTRIRTSSADTASKPIP
ncbi:hypothetical protein Vretifemale_20417, partial [Volvox reticuliferus]